MFISNINKKLIHMKKIKSVLFLLFIVVPSILYGQVVLSNPGFPEKETVIYTQKKDGEYETVKYTMEYRKTGSNSWLEYRFFSNERDVFLKLNSNDLSTFYSESWDKQQDSTVHSIKEIQFNTKQVKGGELLITDMEGFLIALRGFPWEVSTSARIVFLGRSGGFSPELKVKGKESIQINKKNYECWKVQLGMKGVLGAVFPKSYFWFSTENPHYLVRSETAGMPGSSKTVLEIQSYTAGE